MAGKKQPKMSRDEQEHRQKILDAAQNSQILDRIDAIVAGKEFFKRMGKSQKKEEFEKKMEPKKKKKAKVKTKRGPRLVDFKTGRVTVQFKKDK